jgi:pimeloyl-ACP methyl ester carboxylesterase
MERFAHCLALVLALFAPAAYATDAAIVSRTVGIGTNQLHYLSAGHGPAVVLLHGYAETSRMWRPLIPKLATRLRVIAPDLPGIGDSAIPAHGMDMKTAAQQIHALVQSLGIKTAAVVGHDIGLMVAYAYAAMYPNEVTKLAVMDAFLPGVGEGDAIYNDPGFWHFRFHGRTPEQLVRGRERTYFEHYWNDFAADQKHSIPEVDRRAYTVAYARPGRMRAGWLYFASFPEDAKDFAEFGKTKLKMPILSIGGDRSLGEALGRQMRLVGEDLEVIVVKNSGHWLMEEQPELTMAALLRFL